MSGRIKSAFGSVMCFVATVSLADEADVQAVTFHQSPDGSYRFDVTLQHADTGWDHYADRWEVLTPQGDVIATRTLYHPHVEEHPFTRSLSGVTLPPGVHQVVIRASALPSSLSALAVPGGKTDRPMVNAITALSLFFCQTRRHSSSGLVY